MEKADTRRKGQREQEAISLVVREDRRAQKRMEDESKRGPEEGK